MTSGLRGILPREIALAERTSAVDTEHLSRDEAEAVAGSVPARRAEFATGRACARDALRALAYPDAARVTIGVGTHRQPAWPPGIVGSITHCAGWYAAALARTEHQLALGIDVEVHAPVSDDVARLTSRPEEVSALPPDLGVAWPTVLFSAREAIFKAWYPRVGDWLGHHDVRLHLDPTSGRFTTEFLGARAEQAAAFGLDGLEGAASWTTSHIFTGVWVARSQP